MVQGSDGGVTSDDGDAQEVADIRHTSSRRKEASGNARTWRRGRTRRWQGEEWARGSSCPWRCMWVAAVVGGREGVGRWDRERDDRGDRETGVAALHGRRG